MDNTTLLEFPIDQGNESLIISNVIKVKENRDYFLRQGTWNFFRMKEFKTMAWAILEAAKDGMEITIDAILLKSKSCPLRFPVTYEFIVGILNNFQAYPIENFRVHLHQLATDSVKAGIIEKSSSLLSVCFNPATKLSDIEDRLKYLQSIVDQGYSSSRLEFKGMNELIPLYIEEKKAQKNKYTTGFRQLDALLSEGFAPKQITTIAGLSSMGKSSFNLTCMKNLGNNKIYAAQFALEMNYMPLLHKLVAFKSRIPVEKIIAAPDSLTPEEVPFYEAELLSLIKNGYIYLNDKPTQKLKTIREQIMLLQDHLKTEYMVVSIDLFGKIQDLQTSDNFARDYEKTLNILQPMVKELGIHMILIAQIRRDVAHRKFSRPTMNDLKNAGALTEVSDIILGIHRPYYNPEVALKTKVKESVMTIEGQLFKEEGDSEVEELIQDDMNKNIAEVIVLKQRMGENNVLVNFNFDPKTTCFECIDESYQASVNKGKLDLFEGE